MTSKGWRMLGVSCVLCLFACEDRPQYGDVVEPNCGAVMREPCDVRDIECQARVFELTVCARGDATGIFPPIYVIDQDEFEEMLLEASATGQEDAEEEEAWERALHILGLLSEEQSIEEETISELAEDVVGFYAFTSDDLALIDVGRPMDSIESTIILSHEFAHALQDQTVDLEGLSETVARSSDGAVALDALVEGEATHTMFLATALMARRDPRLAPWDDFYEALFEEARQEVRGSDAPLIAAFLSLPYPVGGRYVTDIWLEEGQEAVRALYDNPIATTVEWMDGYGGPTVELEPMACGLPAAPQGYRHVEDDILGAAGVYAFLLSHGRSEAAAWALAKQWRGGKMGVFVSEDVSDGSVMVAWRLAWSDAASASEFESHVLDAGGDASTLWLERRDNEVLIAGTDSTDGVESWIAAAECIPPDDGEEPSES